MHETTTINPINTRGMRLVMDREVIFDEALNVRTLLASIDWSESVCLPHGEAERYDKFKLQSDDLVMSMDGPVNKQGLKIAFLMEDDLPALLLQRVCRFDPIGNVEKRFLYHILHTEDFLDHVGASNRSIAIPHISPGQLKAFGIPAIERQEQILVSDFLDAVQRGESSGNLPQLPDALAGQRRVVARIEELAAKVKEGRELRRQAGEEAEALVGVEAANIFRAALKNGSWALESVTTLERGRFSHRPRNEPRFFGGAHPWIQIGEIENSNKFIRNWTQTLNDDGLAISKKFPRGTVLISIAATIGSVGILDFDCCIPDSIVGVTPSEGTDSEFIYHYLSYLRGHLEEIAPQSAQKNINLQILSGLPVPKLALPEQHRIAAYLDDLQKQTDALKALQAETSTELGALMPSILDKAFRGEL